MAKRDAKRRRLTVGLLSAAFVVAGFTLLVITRSPGNRLNLPPELQFMERLGPPLVKRLGHGGMKRDSTAFFWRPAIPAREVEELLNKHLTKELGWKLECSHYGDVRCEATKSRPDGEELMRLWWLTAKGDRIGSAELSDLQQEYKPSLRDRLTEGIERLQGLRP